MYLNVNQVHKFNNFFDTFGHFKEFSVDLNICELNTTKSHLNFVDATVVFCNWEEQSITLQA